VTSRSDSVKSAECDQSVPGPDVENDFAMLDSPSVEHLVSHRQQDLGQESLTKRYVSALPAAQ
jgi:hypothetical protein